MAKDLIEIAESIKFGATLFIIYNPCLNPIEMLWRHFRREVPHCDLYEAVKVLIETAYDLFRRYNRTRKRSCRSLGFIHHNFCDCT
jgi:hypothetical protein